MASQRHDVYQETGGLAPARPGHKCPGYRTTPGKPGSKAVGATRWGAGWVARTGWGDPSGLAMIGAGGGSLLYMNRTGAGWVARTGWGDPLGPALIGAGGGSLLDMNHSGAGWVAPTAQARRQRRPSFSGFIFFRASVFLFEDDQLLAVAKINQHIGTGDGHPVGT